jgi:hypothetical protein
VLYCLLYLASIFVLAVSLLMEGYTMFIRSTTDPITLNDVPNPEEHPCVYEGDGDNGLEVYFETEENRQIYLNMSTDSSIVLKGDDSDDYIAEG